MKRILAAAAALLSAALFPSLALAQALVFDQTPVAFAGSPPSELLLQSYGVAGGTLYISGLKAPGANGPFIGVAQSFVPSSSGGLTRYLRLTDAKSDAGVPMTAAAGTPSGTVGVSRTAGTSLQLVGETTSSSAKTDKALFELDLPDSYVTNASIPVTINAAVTGSGTLTGASTTLTLAAYTEVNGVETALAVSAAQQFSGAAANYTFTVTGTGLTPGAHIALEITVLVTSASGANTGVINSVAFQG